MSTSVEMLKRIELEIKGRPSDQITELNLDNCRSNGEVEGLTEEFSSLQKISLINAGITSLKSFPKLLKLRKLELSDNRICGPLESLSGLSSLTHLNLSGNKIDKIESLTPLANLTQLISLDLFNCDVTKVPKYRDDVYKLIPSLQYLDGFDRDGAEAIDSDDEEGNEENGGTNGGDKAAEDLDDNEVSDDAADNSKGDDEEESDEGSGDGESADEESEDEEYGLAYLARDNIEDEDDDEDYEEEGDEEDEEIEEDNETGGGDAPRGVKRKRDEEEDEEAPV